jgi:hypothetical protein
MAGHSKNTVPAHVKLLVCCAPPGSQYFYTTHCAPRRSLPVLRPATRTCKIIALLQTVICLPGHSVRNVPAADFPANHIIASTSTSTRAEIFRPLSGEPGSTVFLRNTVRRAYSCEHRARIIVRNVPAADFPANRPSKRFSHQLTSCKITVLLRPRRGTTVFLHNSLRITVQQSVSGARCPECSGRGFSGQPIRLSRCAPAGNYSIFTQLIAGTITMTDYRWGPHYFCATHGHFGQLTREVIRRLMVGPNYAHAKLPVCCVPGAAHMVTDYPRPLRAKCRIS